MSADESPSAGGEGWLVCAKRVHHQDGAPYFFPAKVISRKTDDSAIVVRFLDNGQCSSVPVGDVVGEGPSFRPVSEVVLPKGQLVYFEHPPGHSRSGRVVEHLLKFQKVQIESDGVTLSKPLRQISLLPPAESETKFSRLQEALNGPPLSEAKRADQTEFMDELAAAMVLTSLSCSPASGASSGFGSDLGSPSTLHDDDEDMEIVVDETSQWLFYKCLWPGCGCVMSARNTIGAHVRNVHLGSESDEKDDDYFTAFEVNLAEIDGFAHSLPEPSRNFDHDYHNKHAAAKLSASFPRARATPSLPIDIPGRARSNSFGRQNFSSPRARRTRSEVKKCRKVYGMENRDLWCTHCKWKKACTRFTD